MEEDQGQSIGLFKKYLGNNRIFQNREVLRHSYRPQILPHRRPQIDLVASILAPSLKNETPSNILIYGKTGTGKTACVRYVGAELEDASLHMGTICRVVHINCEQIDTQYRVLAQISKSLIGEDASSSDKVRTHIPMTGWPTDQVYQELKNQLEAEGGVLIIVLDEIDKLVKKSGDETLYNLTRINGDLKESKVSMIGISNDLSFKDFLDPRVLSSLSEEELVFPPYNAPQLCDILQQRADIAFMENALDDGVIPLCAALAAQEHGDARRALDLLRVSGELADREEAERVSESHVKMAQAKIESDSMIECIVTLPTQSKVVLYSMLLLEQMGQNIFTSGEVSRIYKEIAPVLDIDVLTHRRITDLISELNMLGVINTRVVSRGRYGRTKEMWFDANTSKIWDVIQNDQRLSAQGLGQMDIQWVKTLFR
ncbi:MAG TPA: ORC1-type DNA replication protein [Methanoregulaceae archaeon]|jgi:cell division control protein 6|nr:ORC1-type DNA replication protein [Methanolinea sp.]MCC7566754.1 ORC1-type DNA replication protein [Methanoregulaceae archaeon]MDD3091533.1 ORC1-type DNA replication protein [Methanoregulaceae archaeon]MDD5048008.1 ORC1-type DNA replication protein [Methanoregulaceae archaeon]MDD5685477.1 ORC1-type DNA replication protein [Methanoregulaceae archaeon]